MIRSAVTFIFIITNSQAFSQKTTKVFQIDTLNSIVQLYDSLNRKIHQLEMRKDKPSGFFISYHTNGEISQTGNYTQITDTVSIIEAKLHLDYIVTYDSIADNIPRKNGDWISFDSLGRVISIEKHSKSFYPYSSITYNHEFGPYLTL